MELETEVHSASLVVLNWWWGEPLDKLQKKKEKEMSHQFAYMCFATSSIFITVYCAVYLFIF